MRPLERRKVGLDSEIFRIFSIEQFLHGLPRFPSHSEMSRWVISKREHLDAELFIGGPNSRLHVVHSKLEQRRRSTEFLKNFLSLRRYLIELAEGQFGFAQRQFGSIPDDFCHRIGLAEAADFELDAEPVGVDGSDADTQLVGNRFVREPLDTQIDDFFLSG